MNKKLILNDPTLLITKAFVNGKWINAYNGETLTVTNPANNKLITKVARCGVKETKRAI